VTGIEQTAVWLAGFFLAALTFASVAKTRADARVAVARLELEAVKAQPAHLGVPCFPPADWTPDGER
jgi:hypothetical protein